MPNSSYLYIELDCIKRNLQKIAKKTTCSLLPMVKADAYGTSSAKMATFFQSCQVPLLGLSHVNEAIHLRKAGIHMPLFVINAPAFEAEKIVEYQLEPAVGSIEEISALAFHAQRKRQKIFVHLDVNTGMNRFGVNWQEAHKIATYIQGQPFLKLQGVMTHFAAADNILFDPFSREQIERFQQVLKNISPLPRWIHAANSAGSLRFDLPFCNLARVGLALYGIGFENLELALKLESHLSAITIGYQGETIGYDRSFKIEEDQMRIGIIPCGYHDGIHRRYQNEGYVLIHGKKAPMIGHICMDFLMVNLKEIPEAKVGDIAVIFDRQLRPETLAKWGKADVRELLSCLGPRIERVFIPSKELKREEDEPESERISSTIYPFEKNQIDGEHQ